MMQQVNFQWSVVLLTLLGVWLAEATVGRWITATVNEQFLRPSVGQAALALLRVVPPLVLGAALAFACRRPRSRGAGLVVPLLVAAVGLGLALVWSPLFPWLASLGAGRAAQTLWSSMYSPVTAVGGIVAAGAALAWMLRPDPR